MIQVVVYNSIDTVRPNIPSTLPITIQTMVKFTKLEIKAIEASLELLERYSKSTPLPKNVKCNLIFTESNIVTLVAKESLPAYAIQAAIINMELSRVNPDISPSILMFNVLEELCHVLYLINDEHQVKRVVVEILQQDIPQMTLHGCYPNFFDEDNNPI